MEDAVAIITNAGLSETLTDVIDYAKQLVSDVQAGRELTPVPAEAVQTRIQRRLIRRKIQLPCSTGCKGNTAAGRSTG